MPIDGDEPEAGADTLDSLLAAWDEALAAGGIPPTVDTAALPAEVRARLEQRLACMKLLWEALAPTPPQAPTRLPAPGDALPSSLGRFQIRQELGRGGYGVVFLAHDPQLRRDVALKVPRPEALADPELRARFLREAQAASRLDHPNVVPVHEAGEVNAVCYIAAAYCPGISLAQWLRQRDEPVSWREAAALVQTLAQAMQYAHEHGIVHRDLKPANVLLDFRCPAPAIDPGRSTIEKAVPRITDFGLARQLGEDSQQTQSGAILGTPSYMAPEQAGGRSREVGPAADVYALGAILYEMLTGRPPFLGQTVLETLEQVRWHEPVPPGALRPQVPRDLETICLHCLHKESQRRYASAQALAEDLRRFRAGEPIQARPVGVVERLLKWGQRHPAIASLTAVSALVTILGVLLVVWQWRRAEGALDRLEEANQGERAQRRLAEAALAESQTRLYFSRIALAEQEWHAGNLARVLQQLDLCQPEELRGWEWHYLRRLCHCDLLTLRDHTSVVRSVAFSPDGKRLASAAWDGTVKVRDLAAGPGRAGVRLTLDGRTTFLECVAFSPDGKRLAAGGGRVPQPIRPGELRLWDAATGKELFPLRGHAREVLSVAFSKDGRLASGSADQTAKVWDAATGTELLTLRGHTGSVTSVCFSPDGQRLASASRDGTVKVWDVQKGSTQMAARLTLPGHAGVIFSLAFSPDSQQVASAGVDQTVRLWDLATGGALLLRGHTGSVNGVAFSPGGKRLASVSHDRTLKVWDAKTGQELLSVKGHTEYVDCVAFSPDGKRLATGSGDHTIKLWDAATYQQGRVLCRQGGAFRGLAISRDGGRLAGCAEAGHDKQGRALPGVAKVWDLATGQEALSLEGHTGAVLGVAFSPNGRRLASGGGRFEFKGGKVRTWGEVKVWDIDTGPAGARRVTSTRLCLPGHTDRVTAVAFSSKGHRLASASWDRTVKVWDAHTGRALLTLGGHTDTVWDVAFSPDGRRLASASRDRTVRIWDLATGREVFRLEGHGASVNGVAFSPAGRRLASASADQTVRVWDAESGREIVSLTGHGRGVQSVAFSPDGLRLASAALDGTIKLWDWSAADREVLSLKGTCCRVVFSPDGWRLVGAGLDGTIKVWDARPLEPAPGTAGRQGNRTSKGTRGGRWP
jgi:WD40 repeat protein